MATLFNRFKILVFNTVKVAVFAAGIFIMQGFSLRARAMQNPLGDSVVTVYPPTLQKGLVGTETNLGVNQPVVDRRVSVGEKNVVVDGRLPHKFVSEGKRNELDQTVSTQLNRPAEKMKRSAATDEISEAAIIQYGAHPSNFSAPYTPLPTSSQTLQNSSSALRPLSQNEPSLSRHMVLNSGGNNPPDSNLSAYHRYSTR